MKNLPALLQGISARPARTLVFQAGLAFALSFAGLTSQANAQTALTFIPVTPCRVADTRNATGPFGGPSITGQTTRNFTISSSACSIPASAQAYSLNVAVVPQGPLGYLTLWPAGQTQPFVATVNSDGRVKSNAAIVPAGTAGAISAFASNTTDIVIDINGYFISAATAGSLAFYPVTPCRIADTRSPNGALAGPYIPGGTVRAFPVQSSACNIPASAQAYSLNLAAVPRGSLGYLTAFPTGQTQPLAASLNAVTGTVTANAAVVPAGTSGSISVFASNDTDLVIDTNGYFAPVGNPGALALYNVAPCRAADTRIPSTNPAFTGLLNLNISGSSCAPPLTAQSYVFNATVVPSGSFGYLTLFGHGASQPVVATLNAVDGVVAGNLAIVPTTDGSITAFASNATQLVIDLFGYFAPLATPPVISDFNPKSGPAGTLVTLTGTGLASANVAVAALGGGTIAAPLSTASATSLTFAIPAGAATGPLTVSSGGSAAASAANFTVTPSTTFTISAAPGAANLIVGQTVSYTVQMASANGFSQLAPLSITGLPAGVTASFKPSSITAGQTSILTVTAPANQTVGTANISVQATAMVDGIPLTQTAPASLTVQAITTSFLGRAVGADNLETPLAGVAVAMLGLDGGGGTTGCTGSTVSDASGNFALTNLSANCVGPQLIGFGGTKVVSPPGTYAGVQLVFTLLSGKVVVSPVLVHLPRIDNVETFMVTQNATVDQSYTFKTIPNVSVIVYAGTTLTAEDGTKPNPFPLAAIQVPVDRLPDVMPVTTAGVAAFIVAFQPAEATSSKPIPVWFPNTLNSPPGTSLPLMTLDPTRGRMVPYGSGTVSSDGSTVIPDIDPSTGSLSHRYGLVHFDWHGPLGGPPNENDPTPDPNGPAAGEPVDLASGLDVVTSTDIGFHGNRGSVSLTRTYRTLAVPGAIPGPFGYGSFHNFEYRLDTLTPQSAAVINLILPTGSRIPFTLQADGTLRNTTVPMVSGWVMSTSADGSTTVTKKNGAYYKFVPGNQTTGSVLSLLADPNGNVTTIVRPAGAPYQISEIDDPAGRKLTFTFSGYNITQITDPIGRSVSYTYNSAGYMSTYTNVLGGVTTYTYDSLNRLSTLTDPHGSVTKNSFDANGRVSSQVLPSGGTMTFAYTLVNSLIPTSPVTQTVVTDPRGNVVTYRFNTQGFLVGVTDSLGQVRTITREIGSNQVLSLTGSGTCPACGDTKAGDMTYTYDANGNVLTRTDALGNKYSFTYDSVFNNVLTSSDPAGNITKRAYDSHGNLNQLTDARGNITLFAYDGTGLLTSMKDPLGNLTKMTYDSLGNLTALTNPAGQKTLLSYDGASRLVAQLDPLGRTTTTAYNAANQVTSSSSGNGQTGLIAYDSAGLISSLTDANGGKTVYAYDTTGRISTRTDPLLRATTFKYDQDNNLTGFTNRRGQASTFTYDALNRVSSETYTDATVQRTYDSYGRTTKIVDSQSGTFNVSYDAAGRVIKVVNPNGTISYARDANGRVSSRQVLGQTAAAYAYDPNGNLAAATLGTTSVTRTYDARNLLTANTRSNGITGSYAFDTVGRIVSILEKSSTATVFSRNFTYDVAGQITGTGVDTGLPLATPAATGTYDADSQVTSFGGTTYTSDADGNRLTETSAAGTTTYSWTSRGRLQSVAAPGGVTTSFVYDPGGQMIQKLTSSSGSTTTQSLILDDVSNAVSIQQGQGSAVSVLDGRSADDILATVQSGSPLFPMLDQVGSHGALTDAAGTVVGREFYEPFGASTISGTVSPFQFTGRPVVGTGLYYHRARFYDSFAGRFISEDSMQFSDPTFNLYRYSLDSPIAFRDPSGTWGIGIQGGGNADAGGVVGGGTAQIQGGIGVFGGGPSGVNAGNYLSGAAFAGGPGYGVGAPNPAGNSWGGGGVVGGASIGGELGGFFTNAHCAQDLSDNFDTYFINTPIGGVSLGFGSTSDGRNIFIFTIGGGPSAGVSAGGVTTNTFSTRTY